MSFDIFQVDWILVSSLSIIILIGFLICVKIYKFLTRWRYKFVNEDITLSSYQSIEREFESNIEVRKWNYAINNKLLVNDDPIVIILQSKRRNSMLRVITEGLSSYGLRVINILLTIKNFSLDSSIVNSELKDIVDNILELIPGTTNNEKFLFISYNDKKLNSIFISNEKNYQGHIIINSKPINFPNSIEKIGSNSTKLNYHIFSEFIIMKFKNKNIKKYSGTKNLIIVSNATRNFKYFETILFGILLNLINKNNINK